MPLFVNQIRGMSPVDLLEIMSIYIGIFLNYLMAELPLYGLRAVVNVVILEWPWYWTRVEKKERHKQAISQRKLISEPADLICLFLFRQLVSYKGVVF